MYLNVFEMDKKDWHLALMNIVALNVTDVVATSDDDLLDGVTDNKDL